MASVNKVILLGNIGADPESAHFQDGNQVVQMRLATSQSWTDKQTGERKERTEWHTIVIRNQALCKIAMQYLKKGSKLYVEGELQTRKWQDKGGNDRWSTEIVLGNFGSQIVLLDGKKNGAEGDSQGSIQQSGGHDQSQNRAAPPDDDEPF